MANNAAPRFAVLRSIVSLRVTFASGLLLLLLIGGLFVVMIAVNGGTLPRGAEKESTFYRLIREYDFRYRRVAQTDSYAVQRQELERLDNDLTRLEKKAEGVESWLSVLKRRRQLAHYARDLRDFRYEQAYQESSRRAAYAFPYSEPIAAIAAAALIRNSAITVEGEAQLRKTIPLLADSRLAPMRLCLHILLGDLRNPERALENLAGDGGFAFGNIFADLPAYAKEIVAADLAIMKIVAGDIPAAAIDIQAALDIFPSPAILLLAAEYFYDFGDLNRSAELFSMLWDENALSRQADALWFAGYTDNARTFWTVLSSPDNPASWAVLQNRALYNLAMTAQTRQEAIALLERLIEDADAADTSRQFGVIRLSRLFDAPKALTDLAAEQARFAADLSAVDLSAADNITANADALIGLEMLKRRTEAGEVARVVAETWLLLDRYPKIAELYEWGAWYFGLQRNYTETAVLLKTAARHDFDGEWVNLHTALLQIRDGDLNAAEETLRAIPRQDAHWTAAANLGRVLEARLASSQALENYERAAAVLMELDEISASRIQVRIARCLKSLGRIEESRRALEYALDLNPDNLSARLDLSRLEY